MTSIVAGALAVVLLVGCGAGAAEARLPRSPLVVTVSPSSVDEGGRATLHIDLAHGADPGRPPERFDLYLVWVFTPEARFLTPRGTWSAEPIPFRRGVSRAGFTPIVAEWANVGPTGWISLALVMVEPSGNPLSRSSWAFQPALTWVRVKNPAGLTGTLLASILVLAFLTLVAAAIVVVYPGRKEKLA